jgi:hypothetical protein
LPKGLVRDSLDVVVTISVYSRLGFYSVAGRKCGGFKLPKNGRASNDSWKSQEVGSDVGADTGSGLLNTFHAENRETPIGFRVAEC